ncbi:MAG: methyltransferase domain-containing protein [Bacteroidales bacterium]|nr:methyltransferase domain-containing protein [Bacteroidales bacterium]
MIFKRLRKKRWRYIERKKIKKIIIHSKEVNVIIGAGDTKYDNWINTDYPFFDITNKKHWEYLFNNKKANRILSEHVLEHFYENEVKFILQQVYLYLQPTGNIRIAVPDSNHPNPDYIEYVRPGGSGAGADDHKSFWNYKTLGNLLQNIGYKVNLLEYCDGNNKIIFKDFNNNNGIIQRSFSKGFKCDIKDYSSLIIDAYK